MKDLSRVVWTDGMHLSSHHFQAQTRFFETAVNFSVRAVAPWNCGFLYCDFHKDSLKNGTLRIARARGIFPDGTPFEISDEDGPTPWRDVRALTKTGIAQGASGGLDFCLALPVLRQGGNFSITADNSARFVCEPVAMKDEVLGRDEAAVLVGKKNISLLTVAEAQQEISPKVPRWTWLRVARVVQDAAGNFTLDPLFVPAALRVGCSQRLTDILTNLMKELRQRSTAIRQQQTTLIGMGLREVTQFWYLHAIHTCIPRLGHLLSKDCHPAEIYLELGRLAGALCTFDGKLSVDAIPAYDNLDPGASIADLDRFIRKHLAIAFPAGRLKINLQPKTPDFWEGELTDPRLTGRSMWVLAVRSSVSDVQRALPQAVPEVVKLCSARYVGKLVKRQLPGLVLKYLRNPPPGFPPTRGFSYFQIEQSGPCWDDVSLTRGIGIYVPATIPGAELELSAIPVDED